MQVKEEVFAYQVCYLGKPGEAIKPGIHGTFDILDDAIKSADSCAAWFNTESWLETKVDGKKKIETVKSKMHDRVEVWIEELKDGKYFTRKLDAKGKPCDEKKKSA